MQQGAYFQTAREGRGAVGGRARGATVLGVANWTHTHGSLRLHVCLSGASCPRTSLLRALPLFNNAFFTSCDLWTRREMQPFRTSLLKRNWIKASLGIPLFSLHFPNSHDHNKLKNNLRRPQR